MLPACLLVGSVAGSAVVVVLAVGWLVGSSGAGGWFSVRGEGVSVAVCGGSVPSPVGAGGAVCVFFRAGGGRGGGVQDCRARVADCRVGRECATVPGPLQLYPWYRSSSVSVSELLSVISLGVETHWMLGARWLGGSWKGGYKVSSCARGSESS